MEEIYPNLHHSFTPESARYISNKKLALTLGVKASKAEWLLFTEPDCVPASNQWLKLMARNFTSQTDIVLGYSNYEYKKGWLHKRAAFDTLFRSLRYLGFAAAKKPYMGIGRNMAYRKELFFKEKGFSSYLNLLRGEDDIFINQTANRSNTRVETTADAAVRIQPLRNYNDWEEEKVSYLSTARHYRGMQRSLCGLETFVRLLFYAACVGGIAWGIMERHWGVAGATLLLWLLRYTLQAVVVNQAARDLGESRRYYFSLPVFDFLLPLQSLRFGISLLFRRREEFLRR